MIDIGFDVDEVMGFFLNPVLEIVKSRGYTYNEQGYYNILKSVTPDMTREELNEIFVIVAKDPYAIPIAPGAQELCSRLYMRCGDPIPFVTSRDTRLATETHDFIKRFCKIPYTLAFASDAYPKLTFLKHVNYFVDDRRKIAMHLAENEKTVLVPKRGWNDIPADFKHIDNIVYIDNIEDLLTNINLYIK